MLLAYYFVLQACDFLGRSCGSALRILLFVLETCKPCAGTAEAHFAYYFCTETLRYCSRSLGMLGSPQRVRREQDAFARRHSESASTRRMSAEGSPRARQIRTAPQRERCDTQDLRKGFATSKTNSHGATARALRHAQSPQRVRRAQDKFARRHSESASTRTISAKGSPSSSQIRTAPQRERFDMHDLRKGFTFVLQRLQMSETLRLPRNSQILFTKMLRLPHILLHQRKAYCAHHEKRMAVSQNAALATQFCGNTQIRRSARRHSESAVLKKGSFHAKLSHARQLFATTAMALERRLSKRGSLTRQEDIIAWRPCHQKTALWSQKYAFGTRLPEKP